MYVDSEGSRTVTRPYYLADYISGGVKMLAQFMAGLLFFAKYEAIAVRVLYFTRSQDEVMNK
jgi:hypothetical protein